MLTIRINRFLLLTLSAQGVAYMPPLARILYICANTRARALKNLTFPNYKFGKGQYAFLSHKIILFCRKCEVRQKYHNFIGGDPYELVRRPL